MKSNEVSDPELFARLLEDIEERTSPTRLSPEARAAYAVLVAAMERQRPACADDDQFTATNGVQISHPLVAICSACPIRRECGTYAELAQPAAGFWAGTDYTKEPHDHRHP